MAARRSSGWRKAFLGFAVAYPLLLVGVWLLLRFIGEAWWVTGVAIYLPRFAFAVPVPVLTLGLWKLGRTRLLWTQAVAALVCLFPLMGLNVSVPRFEAPPEKKLRVLSYNVNSGHGDFGRISRELLSFEPDIVLIQELFLGAAPLEEALRGRYPHIMVTGQFMLASRFPITASVDPDRVEFAGKARSPRFMKYSLETPIGPLAVFNVHTVSPRGGFAALRGEGLRREIASGRLFMGERAENLQATSELRREQILALAALASKEAGAVLIGGDTNLPHLSPTFERELGHYRDAFVQRGNGFGYTYPAKFPWMRIDRILGNDRLRFVDFAVGGSRASDHLCVVADVALEAD
jgi:vancomycin resistance protein VanJ